MSDYKREKQLKKKEKQRKRKSFLERVFPDMDEVERKRHYENLVHLANNRKMNAKQKKFDKKLRKSKNFSKKGVRKYNK